MQVNKAELVQRLWIPFRDLRQLDPTVSASILERFETPHLIGSATAVGHLMGVAF